MENKSHALLAGIFVLAITGLLVLLAVWLTRDMRQYREYELSTATGISGLQAQAAVRYKGVAVGKVTRIGFDPQVEGNVLIRIAVSTEAPLTPRTFAILSYQGVTGLAYVLLDDDRTDHPALPPGASGLPRLPLRSSPLSLLADQGQALLARADEISSQLALLLGSENQQRIRATLDSLAAAAAAVAQLARTVEGAVQGAQLPQLARQARQTVAEIGHAGAQAGAAAQAVQETLQRLHAEDGLLAHISRSSLALERLAATLEHDSAAQAGHTLREVARAAQQLGSAASSLRENPQSLLYGAGIARPGPGEPGFVAPAPQAGALPDSGR